MVTALVNISDMLERVSQEKVGMCDTRLGKERTPADVANAVFAGVFLPEDLPRILHCDRGKVQQAQVHDISREPPIAHGQAGLPMRVLHAGTWQCYTSAKWHMPAHDIKTELLHMENVL